MTVAVAVVVACVSAVIAAALIIASVTTRSAPSVDPEASPVPTVTKPSTSAAPSSPSPQTLSPLEQLTEQMLAIVKADGAKAAYDLLAAAVDASPVAADLCPAVVGALTQFDSSIDWASACR